MSLADPHDRLPICPREPGPSDQFPTLPRFPAYPSGDLAAVITQRTPPRRRSEEERPFHALADGEVDRPRGAGCQRDGDDLAAFAGDDQSPVPTLDAQGFNVGASSFGDPQSIQRQQGDQRVLRRRAQPSSDQQRAELVAVQPSGVRVVVQPGPADIDSRGVIEQVLLDRVPVEPGDVTQPAGDGGLGTAVALQVAGEALDVRAAGLEETHVMLMAPACILAQVQLVRLAGQAAVAGPGPG